MPCREVTRDRTFSRAALTLGVIGTAIGLARAERERDDAIAVTTVLSKSLASVDPWDDEPGDVTARDILDAVSRVIAEERAFRNHPALKPICV